MPIEPVNRQMVQNYLDTFTEQVRGVAGDLSLVIYPFLSQMLDIEKY